MDLTVSIAELSYLLYTTKEELQNSILVNYFSSILTCFKTDLFSYFVVVSISG